MNNLSVAELQPRSARSRLDRRSAPRWVVLAVVAYVVSAAVVRLFDYLSVRAQYAQLVAEAGPLGSTTCEACMTRPGLVLVWATDWRAVLIWALCAATAAAAVYVSRRPAA